MSSPHTSRDARVDIFVGEGRFPAALTVEYLIKLEERRDAGPWTLLDRLRSRAFRTMDVQETIRWALIGGGMSDQQAFDLATTYVVSGRLMEYLPTAITILYAALYGAEEDDPVMGESEAPASETPTLED